MLSIKDLNINRLLKELDYLKSDIEYKTQLSSLIDKEFMIDVNRVLSINPELNELYLKKEIDYNTKINENIITEPDDEDILYDEIEKSKEIKKLYRNIVKLTHPDKVDDFKLNELYKKSTEFYNRNSLIDMLDICKDLGIKYSIDIISEDLIIQNINSIKNNIKYIESTYTWKWQNTDDDKERDKIIISFIKGKIFK